ncbi:IS982 family transposase, partial [Streptomyces sp. NPDC005146]
AHRVSTLNCGPFVCSSRRRGERGSCAVRVAARPLMQIVCSSLLVIADKGFASKEFEADLAFRGAELLRPSFKREKKRRGESLLKSVRQLIESVNDTLKGQLDLEQHGGRTFEGVAVRVAQRILAMAAAIWHNHKTGQPVIRSLIAYDH